MGENLAMFNVDTQQPSESTDRLVFRPRVAPFEARLAALLDYARTNDIVTVCTACVNAGPVQRVLPDDALFVPMDADVDWRACLDGHRTIWIEKRSCGSPEINVRQRAFDLFCANPHIADILGELGIPNYIVFGDSVGYCVRSTAEGLMRLGYRVTLVSDAIGRGVDSEAACRQVIGSLQEMGAAVTTTDALLQELRSS